MRRSKSKKITVNKSDLPNLVDALFAGNPEEPGWVFMHANAKGRECINALFPRAHIAWRELGLLSPENVAERDYAWPSDWMGFTINLPDAVSVMETKLPLEITRGADLDEAQPAALAVLLAVGVTRQGGRCAVFDEGSALQIFHPSSN